MDAPERLPLSEDCFYSRFPEFFPEERESILPRSFAYEDLSTTNESHHVGVQIDPAICWSPLQGVFEEVNGLAVLAVYTRPSLVALEGLYHESFLLQSTESSFNTPLVTETDFIVRSAVPYPSKKGSKSKTPSTRCRSSDSDVSGYESSSSYSAQGISHL